MAIIYDKLPYLLYALIELIAPEDGQNVWEHCIISINIVQLVGSEFLCVSVVLISSHLVLRTLVMYLLLLNKHYNSCRVLAFSTIFFHSRRSWACSDHLRSFILLRSFLTSSSHLCLGLPTGRVMYGCHLYIFLTMLVSGFLCTCPNQLSLWALT